MPLAEVFVFGSNEAGRHGKGAALHARQQYGAEYGVGRGRTGSAYALPTKDRTLRPVSIEELRLNVDEFIRYAEAQSHERFILTPVGCGLAGFAASEVAAMLIGRLPRNVVLHSSWLEHLHDPR